MMARCRLASGERRRAPSGRALLAVALILAVFGAASSAASAMAAAPCARHAGEAAARARLDRDIILRVMHVESRGRPRAISPKGAMGCMQIMPATWRYLTTRHALGADPWDPRMNMIGGALYLAELIARFGLPGAYAAYNAGPARYARHVANGGALPRETILYTAQLTGRAPPPATRDARRAAAPPRWQEASLFLAPAREEDLGGGGEGPAALEAGAVPPPSKSGAPAPTSEPLAERSGTPALFPLARRHAAAPHGSSSRPN